MLYFLKQLLHNKGHNEGKALLVPDETVDSPINLYALCDAKAKVTIDV
jgi:hypothetical protein